MMYSYMLFLVLYQIALYTIGFTVIIMHKLAMWSCLATFFVCWKLLQRQGEEYWYGFLPFYNQYKMCEIAFGKNRGWFFIFLFIPIINFIFYPIYCNELRKKYNYDSLFTIGLILLPIVFLPILVFDEKHLNKMKKRKPLNTEKKNEEKKETEQTVEEDMSEENSETETTKKDILEKINEKIEEERNN